MLGEKLSRRDDQFVVDKNRNDVLFLRKFANLDIASEFIYFVLYVGVKPSAVPVFEEGNDFSGKRTAAITDDYV